MVQVSVPRHSFLAACSQGIAHRDLKPENILLKVTPPFHPFFHSPVPPASHISTIPVHYHPTHYPPQPARSLPASHPPTRPHVHMPHATAHPHTLTLSHPPTHTGRPHARMHMCNSHGILEPLTPSTHYTYPACFARSYLPSMPSRTRMPHLHARGAQL